MYLLFWGIMFLFLLIGVQYYCGFRILSAIGNVWRFKFVKLIWWILIVFSFAFLGIKFWGQQWPQYIAASIELFGSWWLAFLFYAVILLLIVDMIQLIVKGFVNHRIANILNRARLTKIAVFFVGCIILFGAWNARHPVITNYVVTINKAAGNIQELKAILVADMHLGVLIDKDRLAYLVNMIEESKPDIVFLSGDIIENVRSFQAQHMDDDLKKIKAPYGVYAVPGNHEYLGQQAEQAFAMLEQSNIHLLRDEAYLLDNFYVIGRDDPMSLSETGRSRKALRTIMEHVDISQPVIMLDHEPLQIQEAQQAGVDIQLSGHTHKGQLFPLHFITKNLFETDYGYWHKGAYQLIVTSGYGTWGPPIRVGNHPEVVEIMIQFRGDNQNIGKGQAF